MLKPTKLSRKEKANSEYAGPETNKEKFIREMRTPRSVGKLPTKKAEMLKTAADQPRERMKNEGGQPLKPASESPRALKVRGLKGLIDRAMDKAPKALIKAKQASQSKYKKVDKTGPLGRSVSKEKGLFTRTVDGRNEMVREKSKTVKRADGTVKKTVTKGKGVGGSVIGKYKDVKRYK
jgi:hypothetical protein